MSTHIIDSEIYGSAWGSDEMRAIFDEIPRTQGWLDVIATLAEAQAEVGLIPAEAVPEIRRVCNIELLSMEALGQGYRDTGHSTLGLIRELKNLCQGEAGEWIYYGATVQDITDTWTSLALLKAWAIVYRDLREIEEILLKLAQTHRNTPMPGRTHGQPGLPITFGFKVSVWVREIRRHIERMKDLHKRMGEGQLSGGVGSVSSLGNKGLEVQEKFFAKLGLRTPDIAWIAARDTQVEFLNLLAIIGATFDKIGHEIYTLQRPEIGEVREGFVKGVVGSITMPHKRNPEIAEHLGSLARLIRHNAACLTENLVHDHERDARSWKTEWALLGPTCLMAGSLLRLSKVMCANLDVDQAGMLASLKASRGYVLSEGVMLALAEKVGKQTAHEMVYQTAMTAFEADRPLKDAILENEQILEHLSANEIETLFDYYLQVGLCPEFVDRVAELTRSDRELDARFQS